MAGFTLKKALAAVGVLLAVSGAFVGGIFWEHSATDSTITEIEAVALEACNARIKTIQKLCKK